MGGTFVASWMANLCTALTDHDLSIEQAHAVRGRGAGWLAEFTLHADDAAEDPSGLPYLEWMDSEAAVHRAPLRLRDYSVERVEAHGGTLCLTVDAEDEIGLIGALLCRLAELELCPVEMHVATRAGHAEDRFWLSMAGGGVPTAAKRDELITALGADRRPDRVDAGDGIAEFSAGSVELSGID